MTSRNGGRNGRRRREWDAAAAAQDATEGERLALAYIREAQEMAARMEADADRFSNCGAWLRAHYLLLGDFADALEQQIGHWRRIAAHEAAEAAREAGESEASE